MFPHYTWGYIIYDAAKFGLPVVPSLYVRVYRHCRRQAYHYRSSLTIREGISPTAVIKKELSWFPHYTWGYIELERAPFKKQVVPSLYVRVYRLSRCTIRQNPRSLTIREGISFFIIIFAVYIMFPHYTWGYIGTPSEIHRAILVPSLYVRVYRVFSFSRSGHLRSLTIRDGISASSRPGRKWIPFPHYTWGYIMLAGRAWCSLDVPSLYVRVYRNFRCRVSVSVCSLTTREGISKRNAKKDAKIAFPHYMWVYIGHFRFFQNPAY